MIKLSTGLATGMLTDYGFLSYLDRGVCMVYSDAPPNSPDDPPTGTLLAFVTTNGNPFTEGSANNGLRFDATGERGVLRDKGDWKAYVVSNGVAGWWRMRWYQIDDGGSSVFLPRMDGVVGESLSLANTSLDTALSPFPVTFSMRFNHA